MPISVYIIYHPKEYRKKYHIPYTIYPEIYHPKKCCFLLCSQSSCRSPKVCAASHFVYSCWNRYHRTFESFSEIWHQQPQWPSRLSYILNQRNILGFLSLRRYVFGCQSVLEALLYFSHLINCWTKKSCTEPEGQKRLLLCQTMENCNLQWHQARKNVGAKAYGFRLTCDGKQSCGRYQSPGWNCRS